MELFIKGKELINKFKIGLVLVKKDNVLNKNVAQEIINLFESALIVKSELLNFLKITF